MKCLRQYVVTGRLFIIKKIVTPGCGFLAKNTNKTKKCVEKVIFVDNYSELKQKNHSVLNIKFKEKTLNNL